MKQHILLSILFFGASVAMGISDFAVEVIEYSGSFGVWPYHDPNAVIGKPATRCLNNPADPFVSDADFRVKLVEPAYYLSLQEQPVVTTIKPGAYIIVKFDHKVFDYPGNPYGQDLIVFGNATFVLVGDQESSDSANMNALTLTNPASGIFETVIVSVSQGPADDPNKLNDPNSWDWYTFENGPWADDLYPTQAYEWDRENIQWTDNEMDFTRPVNPDLGTAAFDGISAADAIELYNGSGGGTSFDLKDLPDYDELIADPNTGFRWIQYVRVEGGEGIGGEVDAVADVAACGDPTYPFPPGDITLDCRVDLADLAVLSENWLECTYQCDKQ